MHSRYLSGCLGKILLGPNRHRGQLEAELDGIGLHQCPTNKYCKLINQAFFEGFAEIFEEFLPAIHPQECVSIDAAKKPKSVQKKIQNTVPKTGALELVSKFT